MVKGTLEVSNITLKNNTANSHGGAMFLSGGSPVLTNVTIKDNTATNTGGVYTEDSCKSTINSCTIQNNTGNYGAVHLRNKNSTMTITGNTIVTNNKDKSGNTQNVYLNYHNTTPWGVLQLSGLGANAKLGLTLGRKASNAFTTVVFDETTAPVQLAAISDTSYKAGMIILDETDVKLIGDADGSASVSVQMKTKLAEVAGVQYVDISEAVAAAIEDNAVVKLLAEITDAVEIPAAETVALDLNGKNVAKLTGTGTVILVDTQTDDYDVEDGKYGKITEVDETVTLKSYERVNGKRYIVLTDENGTHAHRIYAAVTAKALRAKDEGIGYTAMFGADQVLQKAITGYGVELSANGGEAKTVDVKALRNEFVHGRDLMFVISDFFKDGEDNNVRAGYEITGTPFVMVGQQKHTDVADTQKVTFKQMFNYADEKFGDQSAAAQAAIYKLYTDNPTVITAANGWSVTNVSKYAAQ